MGLFYFVVFRDAIRTSDKKDDSTNYILSSVIGASMHHSWQGCRFGRTLVRTKCERQDVASQSFRTPPGVKVRH